MCLSNASQNRIFLSIATMSMSSSSAVMAQRFARDLTLHPEDPRRVEELLIRLSACVRGLRAIDAPIIARVQGAALAGGCALLTGCDFVVVAADEDGHGQGAITICEFAQGVAQLPLLQANLPGKNQLHGAGQLLSHDHVGRGVHGQRRPTCRTGLLELP